MVVSCEVNTGSGRRRGTSRCTRPEEGTFSHFLHQTGITWPPTPTPQHKLCWNRCDQYRQWQHQTMEQLALPNGKNLRR